MEVHAARPSLISPQHHRRQEEDASSSSVNQDMILEEVRRQVAVAMQDRDREVVSLKQKNKELEEALIEANKAMRQKVGAGETQSSSAVRPEENHGLPDGLNEPPGLGHDGRGDPRSEGGRDKTSTTETSGTSTGVRGDGSGVEPLQLLVQGMRQLQQVYIGKGESRDSELKGTVELPMMPEVAADSAVSFADWLYEVEQAVGGLSDRAAGWFSMCLKNARETYEIYQMSDPLARLTLEPLRPAELQDERWSRLERRVLTLLLATLQRQAKDDAVTHRISNVSGLLFRLHVLYAPGSAAERASILRHLEGSPGTTSVVDTVTALRRWRRLLPHAEEMHVAVPDPSVLLKAIETMAARAIDANPELKFRLSLSKSQLHLQYRPTLENVLRYYNHVSAELQQAAPTRYWRSGFANKKKRRGWSLIEGGQEEPVLVLWIYKACSEGVPGESRTFYLSGKGKDFSTGPAYELFFDYNPNLEPGVGAATASNHGVYSSCYGQLHYHIGGVNFGSATTDNDWSFYSSYRDSSYTTFDLRNEISALLQQANAMLNRLTRLQALQVTSETSLQELKIQMAGLGFAEEERMALLDSGASHPFRERARHEDDGVPVRVELAGGRTVTLKQNKAGTLMPTADTENAQDLSTILPMGALVQSLGCELSWTRKNGLKIVHPQFGALKTVVKGNCPLLGETQALDLIHQLEQKKLQELREATAETFLGTLSLSEIKDWDEMFAAYVQTGQRAHLSQALESTGCPLQGLDGTLRTLLAVGVDLSEEAGRRYLKALPIRRSQRKSLLSKRWIVKLYGREGESIEPYKAVETDKTVFLDVNARRSKGFSMKGASPMFQALMWAAARGQIEGVLGAPPSNACAELATKQLLVWMVAKEGARRHRQTAPYVVTTLDPEARWWTSTVWQGFQREYQIPVAQVSPTSSTTTYCVASNLELCTEEDENNVGWGPGITASSKVSMGWSLDFNKMITQGILSWRRRPEPLMMYAAKTEAGGLGLEELRKWRRHIANGHLPYDRRCKTCVETAATGRSHRRVIAPSCYTLSLDLCGPFRTKGETADAKGYRYALVGNYTMPMIEGYKDHKIPEDTLEEEPGDDGGGVGPVPSFSDVLDEVEEPDPEMSEGDKRELEESNEEFRRIFKEIGDDIQYQNLYYVIPLKTRLAPEVEAAIRLLYVQLRAEGLPVQRVHSDRARELRGQNIRRWLLERDIYPTTGEAQVPQTNGRAEQAVTIKAKVFGQGGKFDLNNKWDTGCFVGPSTEVRGGYVVRDVNGRYLTTMHMKKDVVNVEEIVGPIEVEAVLPLPSTRLRRKVTVIDDGDGVPPPTRDSEQGSTSLGPTAHGEVVVPEEDIVPPPTRDSELGSTSLGPLGEVVVPDMSASSGSGSQEHEGVSKVPGRRLREKSRLMAMRSLTDLEQEIEDLAVGYDLDERYDEEAVLRIFEMLEQTRPTESRAAVRKSMSTSTVWTTGMFTHGGVSGIRNTAVRLPSTTAFLVKAAKKLTGTNEFAVVAITRGARLRVHRDSHNEPDSENTILALTEFHDGGVWVEGLGKEWREVLPGRWIQGGVQPLHLGAPISFSPRRWHETQEFEGDRVVLMMYTPRTSKLKVEDRWRLSELGFKIPERRDLSASSLTTPILKRQQLILDCDGALELHGSKPTVEEEAVEEERLDGTLLRANEYQQQMMDEMMDRSTLLQDLLEEEEERLQDLQHLQQGCLETSKQAHGELLQIVDNLNAKIERERQLRDEGYYLRSLSVEQDSQDYEKLLSELQEDLQVTHTIPLNQVKPVAEKWRPAIEKEIKNLFGTNTLKRIKMSEARRLEAEGRLRLVPSKGVFTIKPPAEKGSLYAGGVGAETLRALLDGEAWLVCRPLYGLRESPSIWAGHRNNRLKALKIPYGNGFITLQQSTTDAELWYAVDHCGEERARGTLLALIITYVDDLFYMGPTKVVQQLHNWVNREWPCSELQWASTSPGVRYLGMEIFQRESGEYEVTQNGYIMDLIRAHDLTDAPQTLLPCPREWIAEGMDQESEDFNESDLKFAQRLVGEQLWLAMRCRPDIHFTVSHMASWVARQPRRVAKVALRVLSYLHKTAEMTLILGQPAEVRSSYLIQRVQDQELHVQHVDGIKQRADLSTKCHSKARLYTLLKLWRFERLPPEAEAFLVARMTAIVCMIKMLESLPKVTAATTEEAKDAVKIAGVDELVFVTVLACAAAILVWEIVKAAGKQLWICLCRPTKGRKARKLRDLAKAAAEVEVDRAFKSEPDAPVRRPTLGAVSSTAWVPSSLDVQQRSIATQTEDWMRASTPVVVTPPRQVRTAFQDDEMYVHFDGPFFKSEYGCAISVVDKNLFTNDALRTDLQGDLSVLRIRGLSATLLGLEDALLSGRSAQAELRALQRAADEAGDQFVADLVRSIPGNSVQLVSRAQPMPTEPTLQHSLKSKIDDFAAAAFFPESSGRVQKVLGKVFSQLYILDGQSVGMPQESQAARDLRLLGRAAASSEVREALPLLRAVSGTARGNVQ
ncbi:TY5A, partial [Symbiodinium sp. KB8]